MSFKFFSLDWLNYTGEGQKPQVTLPTLTEGQYIHAIEAEAKAKWGNAKVTINGDGEWKFSIRRNKNNHDMTEDEFEKAAEELTWLMQIASKYNRPAAAVMFDFN
jgi:hypothetical protein